MTWYERLTDFHQSWPVWTAVYTLQLIVVLSLPARPVATSGLRWRDIYHAPAAVSWVTVFVTDLGAICLLRWTAEGRLTGSYYLSWLLGDGLALCLGAYLLRRAMDTRRYQRALAASAWLRSGYTQAAVIVIAVGINLAIEANHVRAGAFTMDQELSPTKVWHTVIFGLMAYWLVIPYLVVWRSLHTFYIGTTTACLVIWSYSLHADLTGHLLSPGHVDVHQTAIWRLLS